MMDDNHSGDATADATPNDNDLQNLIFKQFGVTEEHPNYQDYVTALAQYSIDHSNARDVDSTILELMKPDIVKAVEAAQQNKARRKSRKANTHDASEPPEIKHQRYNIAKLLTDIWKETLDEDILMIAGYYRSLLWDTVKEALSSMPKSLATQLSDKEKQAAKQALKALLIKKESSILELNKKLKAKVTQKKAETEQKYLNSYETFLMETVFTDHFCKKLEIKPNEDILSKLAQYWCQRRVDHKPFMPSNKFAFAESYHTYKVAFDEEEYRLSYEKGSEQMFFEHIQKQIGGETANIAKDFNGTLTKARQAQAKTTSLPQKPAKTEVNRSLLHPTQGEVSPLSNHEVDEENQLNRNIQQALLKRQFFNTPGRKKQDLELYILAFKTTHPTITCSTDIETIIAALSEQTTSMQMNITVNEEKKRRSKSQNVRNSGISSKIDERDDEGYAIQDVFESGDESDENPLSRLTTGQPANFYRQEKQEESNQHEKNRASTLV